MKLALLAVVAAPGLAFAGAPAHYHTETITLELTLSGVTVPQYASKVLKSHGVKRVTWSAGEAQLELVTKPGPLSQVGREELLAASLVALGGRFLFLVRCYVQL